MSESIEGGKPWISTLPKGWRSASLRWLANVYAGGTPSRDVPEYWTDGSIPWLNSGAVNDWSISRPSEWITQAALDASSAKWIPSGSVLVALAGQGKTKGKAARLEFESTCNQSMAAIVPGSNIDYRYLHFWLASNYERIRNLGGGDLRDGLNLEHLGDIPVPLPPLDVQERIADFLDDQTTRIDNIIGARQKQIELVALALDSRWSSSLEDLGSRFRSPKLRWLVDSISDGPFGSALKSSDYTDSGVRVIRLGNVGINSFKGADRAFVSEEYGALLSQHRVKAGDVIMAGLGDDKWPLGRCAVVPSDLGVAINKADCYRIRVGPSVTPEYVAWAVSAPPSRSSLALLARGATRSRLNTQVAGDLPVPLPPQSVQHEVVNEWRAARSLADRAVTAADQSLARLQELKRSLISAAVSGEFDVGSADGSGVVV